MVVFLGRTDENCLFGSLPRWVLKLEMTSVKFFLAICLSQYLTRVNLVLGGRDQSKLFQETLQVAPGRWARNQSLSSCSSL